MNLTVLWLDDQRNPETYFNKKDEKGEGTFHDNLMFYNELRKKYNLSFVWVKNYDEFVNYIEKNGVPQMVSFDHDLSKTSLPTDPKGLDCAKWLVEYCRKNGVPMPKTYVHSANPKWSPVIRQELGEVSEGKKGRNIILTEEQLLRYISRTILEGVYVNDVKGNKAKLTYKRGLNRNIGSLVNTDNIKTDKMDENTSDTYEVTLKGGITSYNITSINGTEVMHYFKNYFKRQKTEIQLKSTDGNTQSYELTMEDREFKEFLSRFIMKVSFVIYHCLQKFSENGEVKFSGISVYPVNSSSNFNVEMAKQIAGKNLTGLPTQAIDENLFVKDLRNLQKDTDFISKNQDYFNSPLSNTKGNNQSVNTYLDSDISRYKALEPARKYIEEMTRLAKALVVRLYNLRSSYKDEDRNNQRMINAMVEDYKKYYEYYLLCNNISYENSVTGDRRTIHMDKFAEQLKYSKDPQIEIRSHDVWSVVKPYLRGQRNPVNGKPYVEIPLQGWVYKNFQIKNLTNGERMGLRNYYSPNEDTELVERELEKIKGTVFVIFDDNISGGATLSDICYQAKSLGIEYIIPITFGRMNEKWTIGMVPLNKPKNGFTYSE